MGSPSIPAAPAAPDYAAANRDAITTDISTLPLRRQIDNAARLGTSVTYTDPSTGQQRTADFTGTGDSAYATQMATMLGSANADIQRQQLALRRELGTANAAQTAAELQAADPQAYAMRQRLLQRANDDLNLGPANVAPSANIASAENRLWNIANSAPGADDRTIELYNDGSGTLRPRLGNIYDAVTQLPGEARDASSGALNEGLQRALEEFRLGGKLNESEKRDLLNEARSGQAARGNYLGDAAAVAEAAELGRAGDARAQQRLANLLDIQGRAFGQNTQLRGETTQNQLNRIGALSNLEGQRFGMEQSRLGTLGNLAAQNFGQQQQSYTTGLNAAQAAFAGTQSMANDQRAARQEGFGYDQARLGNAQNIGLGAPLTGQFGALGGAQQGAVGFTPVNFTPGQTTNPNAGAQGAQFAQGNFGTQASIWGQQANLASQGNPWMSLLGNAAGAAGGAAAMAMI